MLTSKQVHAITSCMASYLIQVLIAFDQLLNAARGGYADETLSAAAFRIELQGVRTWPRQLVDALFFWQDHHCYRAWRSEIERRQLPDTYRINQC